MKCFLLSIRCHCHQTQYDAERIGQKRRKFHRVLAFQTLLILIIPKYYSFFAESLSESFIMLVGIGQIKTKPTNKATLLFLLFLALAHSEVSQETSATTTPLLLSLSR